SELPTSLDEYVQARHAMFLRILNLAKEKERITDRFYDEFIIRSFEPETWDEAFNELEQFGREINHATKNYDYYKLLERIDKGEEMIEKATDEKKKAQYQALYDKLVRELEGMSLE